MGNERGSKFKPGDVVVCIPKRWEREWSTNPNYPKKGRSYVVQKAEVGPVGGLSSDIPRISVTQDRGTIWYDAGEFIKVEI